nr:ribosomal protein L2 [Ipomoea batatas]
MPLGTAIHNIEITLGKGGQLARAASAVAKLITKEGKSATIKLPSGEVRLISKNCSATVGQVGNVGVNQKSLGRAGAKRWLEKAMQVIITRWMPVRGSSRVSALLGSTYLARMTKTSSFVTIIEGVKKTLNTSKVCTPIFSFYAKSPNVKLSLACLIALVVNSYSTKCMPWLVGS